MIATQQATAQLNQWSLEESELKFQFDPSEEEKEQAVKEEQGFIITGLTIESAEFDQSDKRIKMSAKLTSNLPTVLLKWVRKTNE